MAIVKKIAAQPLRNVEKIMAVLDGCSGQEIADALLLAIVEHIEACPSEHHRELAAGMAGALLANFNIER